MAGEIENPTTGATSGPDSQGGSGDQVPQGGDQGNSGRDLISRVRSDPDFAERTIRETQSRRDSAESKLQKLDSQLGGLKELIENGATGDQIRKAVEAYNAIATDPKLVPVLRSYYESGELRLPDDKGNGDQTVDDDEYKTPEEKQIDALKAEIANLRGEIQGTSSSFAEQQMHKHIENAVNELNLSGDAVEKGKNALVQKFNEWNKTEEGRKAIKSIVGPNGSSTVQTLLIEAIGPKGILDAAEQRLLRDKGKRARLATDGPSQIGTSGDQEPLPDFGSGRDAALKALQFFKTHPERNPHNARGD